MKRFLKNVFFVLLPLAIWVGIELFALPIDYFCIRPAEALLVFTLQNFLPGPFYPSYVMERDEVGNLAAHTSYAVTRHVHWTTDRYGFRYDNSAYAGDDFDVVIVGDSQIQGGGLDQQEMLDVVLAKRLSAKVYPYASYSLNEFLNDPRFQKHPPKVVVYARTEVGLLTVSEVKPGSFDRHTPYTYRTPEKVVVLADRVLKAAWLNALKSWGRYELKHLLRDAGGVQTQRTEELSSYATLGKDGKMLFQSSDLDLKPVSDPTIDQLAQNLAGYQAAFRSRGITFLFYPIPNKSSVYYENVGWQKPPDFLPRLVKVLQSKGIQAVDSLPALVREARLNPNKLLYQLDDTHWGPNGVEFSASLLEKPLQKALNHP